VAKRCGDRAAAAAASATIAAAAATATSATAATTSAYENANFTWEKQAAGDDNLLLLLLLLTQNSCKVVAELINLQLAAVAFVKMPPNAYFDVVAAAVVALKQTIRIENERNKIEI